MTPMTAVQDGFQWVVHNSFPRRETLHASCAFTPWMIFINMHGRLLQHFDETTKPAGPLLITC
jgi:hypothetical protein